MSQGEKKFSHISVSSDEDDEFVIEAGVSAASRFGEDVVSGSFEERVGTRASGASGAENPSDRLHSGESLPSRGSLRERQGEGDSSAAGETAAPEEPARGRQAGAKQAARPAAGGKGDYQPTTLEDLKGTSMSTMQKAIIGLALAGIVAAVVYYVVVLA